MFFEICLPLFTSFILYLSCLCLCRSEPANISSEPVYISNLSTVTVTVSISVKPSLSVTINVTA